MFLNTDLYSLLPLEKYSLLEKAYQWTVIKAIERRVNVSVLARSSIIDFCWFLLKKLRLVQSGGGSATACTGSGLNTWKGVFVSRAMRAPELPLTKLGGEVLTCPAEEKHLWNLFLNFPTLSLFSLGVLLGRVEKTLCFYLVYKRKQMLLFPLVLLFLAA